MTEQVKVRLHVSAQAASRVDLIQRLYDQAVAFFGDEEFVLDTEIEVNSNVEVVTTTKQIIAWEGDGWFRSRER